MAQKNKAQELYHASVEALEKFCEEHTKLECIICDQEYPYRVMFIPQSQQSLIEDENVSPEGEVNDLTVTVGLDTAVKSTLKFKMDAKLLKKLIKLAETVGQMYYHAFREMADNRWEGED